MASASTPAIEKTHLGATLKRTSGRSGSNTAAVDTASHASTSSSLDDTLIPSTTTGHSSVRSSRPTVDTTESSATPTTATTLTTPPNTHVVATPSTQGPSTTSSLSTSSFASAGNSSLNGTVSVIEPSRNEYTVGQLAGGIVGAALGAAILTFLATCLICQRKNRRGSQEQRSVYSGRSPNRQPVKGAMAVVAKPAERSEEKAFGWMAYLPQSADDGTVQNAVKTLFDQIELHVDNYYRKTGNPLSGEDMERLQGFDSDHLPAPIADMMSDPQTIQPTAKHSIAAFLITRITPSANASGSLLPGHLAMTPDVLKGTSKGSREQDAARQAYSHWKVLCAFLFSRSQREQLDSYRLQLTKSEISNSIFETFSPWQANPLDEDARRQHVDSLVAQAYGLGLMLSSQSCSYRFRWNGVQSGDGFVVFPAFVKTSDEQGRRLDKPQTMIAASKLRRGR